MRKHPDRQSRRPLFQPERVDRRGQHGLRPDGVERLLHADVSIRSPRAGFGLDVQPRIDQERADARDVEELGADGILHFALLAAVDDDPHEHDGEHGDDREQPGQAKAEAVPEPQGRGRTHARH